MINFDFELLKSSVVYELLNYWFYSKTKSNYKNYLLVPLLWLANEILKKDKVSLFIFDAI